MSGFDTGRVTDMNCMFYDCSGLTSLDVSGLDTGNVTDMSRMFYNCCGLTGLNVSGFDTGSVTDMNRMFTWCSGLTSLDVSGFITGSVTDMNWMFYGCSKLKNLDVSGFDTGSVTDMSKMFSGCSGLTALDLSSFDLKGTTKIIISLVDDCNALTRIYTPCNFPSEYYNHLPGTDTDVWYDSAGTTYTSLPQGLDHSIILAKNKQPEADMPILFTVRLAKSVYEWGSVVMPEDLTVKYRGKDGRTVVLPCKSETVDGYTMGTVDMDTPGAKTLTISYDNGTETLTAEVSFRVIVTLTDDMVTLPEAEYVYNGSAHQPVPTVKSVDGKALTLGKDYSVEYADNTDAGEGRLTVSGLDPYSGTVTKTFAIRKASPGVENVTFTEPCGKAQENRTRDLSGYFAGTASDRGGISYAIGEVTEHNDVPGGEGNVLSGTPVIDASGILTYSVNAGTEGDTVQIPITVTFAKNYEDARINVTVCVTDKTPVTIFGLTVADITYNGRPAAPRGIAVVRTGDGAGKDVTAQVTLSYHYTGTQADGTAYDSSAAPVHAGSYVLAVAVEGDVPYVGSAEYPFAIRKAPLTVTASDVELVIGAFDALPEESALTWKLGGLCGKHTARDVLAALPAVSYGLNGEVIDKASIPIDKAGSYELLPHGAELNREAGADYEITGGSYRKGTLTIRENSSDNPDNPDKPVNPDNPDNPDKPDNPDNPDNPDKPVNPDNPDDPDNPVAPGAWDANTFYISRVPDQTYTGSAIKPAVTVYYGSRRLAEKKDYTVAYKNNTGACTDVTGKKAPTITVTGKGNYSGRQSITFVIKPKSIEEEDVTAAGLFAAQGSKAQKPVPSLTYRGRKLKNRKDFTVEYPDEGKPGAYQEAGDYRVTVKGNGNYTGTRELAFTITTKTLLTKAKVTVKAQKYTVGAAGSGVTLTADDITVRVGKADLTYGKDYTLAYRNNTAPGRATVIVTGTGDSYAGSKEATFQITGEPIAKAQVTGITDKTYTGEAQTQDLQVQLNGRTLQKDSDYTVSYAKPVNAGKATITITGKGAYTGSVKKTFRITAYDLETDKAGKLQGIPRDLTAAYTKGGATPFPSLSFNNKALVAGRDYTVTYKNNKKPAKASDAKAPTMVIRGKGNFRGTLTIPFTIGVSRLEDGSVAITAADTAYVNKPGKYRVKPVLTDANGKKLTAGADYGKDLTYTLVNKDGTEKPLTVQDAPGVGSTVKVTVTGKGNYTGSLSATYHITETSFAKARITVKPQAYTGGAVTLDRKDITVKLGGDTLTYGTDYTVVEGSYRNNIRKGTATVVIKGAGDYGGTKTVRFRITTRPLTAFLIFNL